MRFAILLALAADCAWCNHADVYIDPSARGDVRFTISADFESAGLHAAVLSALHCDLPAIVHEEFLSGVCPHMIPSRAGLAHGSLDLAPLAAALHSSGADTVTFQLRRNGALARESDGWRDVESGDARVKVHRLQFTSASLDDLPAPLEIRMGRSVHLAELLPPLLIVLFVPGLLALWLERRRDASALVWLNWIMLGSWLYWISAIDVSDLSAYAGTIDASPALGLAIAAAFFSVPPLLSMASCLIALTPRLLPGSNSAAELARLLKRTLAGSAARLVPLGIFLVGAGMFEYGWQIGMASLLAAYLAYRILTWYAWRWGYVDMRAVDRGEFSDRVRALAAQAHVPLKSLYILRNRLPREANAFAMGAGRIAITESLLRNLTRREVDAVVAHELGHLKGSHVAAQSGAFWILFFLAGPAVDFAAQKLGLPPWFRSLPLAAALFTVVMAQLSKRHEFSADARAAEITGDPEAKIAALARLARLTSSPLDWGGIQGSILSHPSMKQRVLAIARRSNLPEPRALELLHDPDLLEPSLARLGAALDPASLRYPLPPELEHRDPLFNTAAKLSFNTRNNWLIEGSIVALLFLAAWTINRLDPFTGINLASQAKFYLLALPLVYWLVLAIEHLAKRTFFLNLRDKLRARIPHRDAEFVGLLPGPSVVRTEGFGEWDLGFLDLTSNRLTYRGERTEFSLTASDIQSVTLEKGPFSWSHPHRVMIRWTGGAFSVQRPQIARSRRQALRLISQIESWRIHPSPASVASPLPPPNLPPIAGDYTPKIRVAAWVARKIFKLAILAVILDAILSARSHIIPLYSFVMLTAPLLWLFSALPTIFARRPKSRVPPPVPIPAEPVMKP